jgi:hypothetical protein
LFIPVMRLSLFLCTLFLCSVGLSQETDTLAVLPPYLQRDEEEENIEMVSMRIMIALYRNGAAVYSEAAFRNNSSYQQNVEVGLPSDGFSTTGPGGAPLSSKGLLGLEMWVGGEKVLPDAEKFGDELWYLIMPLFPEERELTVRCRFWISTTEGPYPDNPSADSTRFGAGKRILVVPLQRSAMWSGFISNATVALKFMDGWADLDSGCVIQPENFDMQDSLIIWSLDDLEPSADQDILIQCETGEIGGGRLNSLSGMSAYFTETGYRDLMDAVDQQDQ